MDGVMFFGELGLDGRLRPVRGVLPAVAAAVEWGFDKVMVAEQNAAEAALVPDVQVIAAGSLTANALLILPSTRIGKIFGFHVTPVTPIELSDAAPMIPATPVP